MKSINITFNSEQFQALIKLVYLGEWLLNAHKVPNDDNPSIEEEVEQMIYALNTEAKVSEYDEDFKKYFPTRDYEDQMNEFIQEYEISSFWEELAYQLADRDTKIELGDNFEKVDSMQFISVHHKYLEYYIAEFSKNDLNNIRILKESI